MGKADKRREREGNVLRSSGGAKEDAPSAAPRAFERAAAALRWPGLFGWLGTGFGVAGIWFVASALALRSNASRMTDASARAREAAEGSRSLGFGEWFLLPSLRPSRAGIAIRESLDPGARGAAVYVERAASLRRLVRVAMAWRTVAGARPGTSRVDAQAPCWIRLTRRGDVLEGFISRDGRSWVSVDESSPGGRAPDGGGRKVRMGRRALVGFLVRPAGSEACSARFDRVRTAPEADLASPPFREATVGGKGAAGGSAAFSGGSVVVTGDGFPAAAARAKTDSFRFVYAGAGGDCEVVARVALPDPARTFPDPLAGSDLDRARLGAGANARASGVFGAFALVVAAFWWGFRLLEPSLTAREEKRRAG